MSARTTNKKELNSDSKWKNQILEHRRKSYIERGTIYFWTATINQWHRLLEEDCYKDVVIGSLKYLSQCGKIEVFVFVVMPNHIHLIWRVLESNCKESPQGSLLKFTAHEFRKMLISEGGHELRHYAVDAHNKAFEFWQRD